MPVYAYAIVLAGSILWAAPFPLFRSGPKGAFALDRRARWGVLMECLGYTLLWQGPFWTRSAALWQVLLSALLFAVACVLSWTSAGTLGRQFRVDAMLSTGHELVQTGPYRFVRHPIYTSMLCVVAGTGLLIAPLYLFIPALLLFLTGTEIRMRIEDGMLASRFGDRFKNYQRAVPRFIPFLKA